MPKALAESKIKFSFSSFSVTLLRPKVYLSNHTWYQTFYQSTSFASHLTSTYYSMQYNGSSSSLAARSRRFKLSFKPCKVNLNTRRGEALRPDTHQPSPSIPWQQKGAHRLGVQCLTDPDRTCTHHNRNGRPRLRSREEGNLRAGSLRY